MKRKYRRGKRIDVVYFWIGFILIGLCYLCLQKTEREPKLLISEDDILSKSVVEADPSSIPDYVGKDVIELNGNVPGFTTKDLEYLSGESYTGLDSYGRCGVATAMLDRTMMPDTERESIGSVKPSGWIQAKYPGCINSSPPYIYQRCHLIAHALSGQNANPENLFTDTHRQACGIEKLRG